MNPDWWIARHPGWRRAIIAALVLVNLYVWIWWKP